MAGKGSRRQARRHGGCLGQQAEAWVLTSFLNHKQGTQRTGVGGRLSDLKPFPQWCTSSSNVRPPKPLQIMLPTRDKVFKCQSIWGTAHSNLYMVQIFFPTRHFFKTWSQNGILPSNKKEPPALSILFSAWSYILQNSFLIWGTSS